MSLFIRDSDCGCACSDDPCVPVDPPLPILKINRVQGAKTKCATTFPEWPGYVSTPPKRYLKTTLSGSLTIKKTDPFCGSCSEQYIDSYSGACIIDRINCTFQNLGTLSEYTDDCFGNYPNTVDYNTCGISASLDLGISTSYSLTTAYYTGIGCAPNGNGYFSTGIAYAVLSDEYTTAQLITDATNKIPNYPNSFITNIALNCASIEIDNDQFDCIISQFKYKFQIPSLSGYTNYIISWYDEYGNPMSYSWNGTDTETPVYGPVVGTGAYNVNYCAPQYVSVSCA